MNITLTVEQAKAIQEKLQSGQYQSIEDIMLKAFQLLEEWEEENLTESPDWIDKTRVKVDQAIKSLSANGGHDGETVVNQLLEKLRQASEK
jgi:antitoxin ParD1/3/4